MKIVNGLKSQGKKCSKEKLKNVITNCPVHIKQQWLVLEEPLNRLFWIKCIYVSFVGYWFFKPMLMNFQNLQCLRMIFCNPDFIFWVPDKKIPF